jgi:hypothetical protein
MKLLERLYNRFAPWYSEDRQRDRDAGCAASAISAHVAIAKADAVVSAYRSAGIHVRVKK